MKVKNIVAVGILLFGAMQASISMETSQEKESNVPVQPVASGAEPLSIPQSNYCQGPRYGYDSY